jgi:hypothetical protein
MRVTHQTVQRCLDRAARLGTMVVLDVSMLVVDSHRTTLCVPERSRRRISREIPYHPTASNATGMVLKSGTFREPEAPSEQASAAPVC